MSVKPGDYPSAAAPAAQSVRSGGRRQHPYAGPIALISAGCAGMLAIFALSAFPEISVPAWLAVIAVSVAITAIVAPIVAGRVGGSRV